MQNLKRELDNKVSLLQATKILASQLKNYKVYLSIAIFGIIIFMAATKFGIYGYLIPRMLDEGFIAANPEFLRTMPYFIPLIFLGIGFGEFLSKFFMGLIGRSVVCDYRKAILQHLLVLPIDFYKQHSSGELISKINYDCEQMATAVSDSVKELLSSLIAIVFAFLVMLSISWQVTLLLAAVAPIVGAVLNFVNFKIRRYSAKIQQTMANLTHVSNEVIRGHEVIRAYQSEQYERDRVAKVCENNCKQEIRSVFITALSSPVIQLMGAIVLVIFVYLVTTDSIEVRPGQMVGLMGAMYSLLRPIKQLSQVNGVIQKGIVAVTSIDNLLDMPAESDCGTQNLTNVHGILEFKEVSFAYSPAENVLSNISFSAFPGQTVAIVGRSGAGKSTLASLISRFYQPTYGSITIDGNNISDVTLTSLRSNVSLVTQNVTLFSDTIANNIAYGSRDKVTMEQIIQAAKFAHIYDFIMQQELGFETAVGENGCRLSGGQRQRLAIARAILKDAPIIILDEATSALDNESEKYIQQGLNYLKQGRTTIIIAHRLSTIENADKILVMEAGKIVEQGSHQQLIQQGGAYQHLQQSSQPIIIMDS